jgi:anti-sigma regulatory factor (Ser/Thr protein kinase)
MPQLLIRDSVDIFLAQGRVRSFSQALGFTSRESTELAIVASELCSNILKYGSSGSLEVDKIEDENGLGIVLLAHDRGPPFRDLEVAVRDGWDDSGPIDPFQLYARKGIGGGLGAVLRLSDDMRVEPEEGGKLVRVVRYVQRKRPA